MRLIRVSLIAIALSIASLWAQPTSVSGPVEGYIFDLPTKSFLAVTGIPGAATLGPALISGVDCGWVAPHGNYAIGFQRGSGFLVRGLDSNPQLTSIPGLSSQPDGVTWSNDGSKAILYSSTARQRSRFRRPSETMRTKASLQVLSGLPAAPQLGALIDLASLDGTLAAVATDPQGRNIAVAMQGPNGGVFLSTDGQTFHSVLPIPHPAGIVFSGDGTSLYIVDGESLTLTVFGVSDGSTQTFPLSGMANPSVVAAGQGAQGRSLVYLEDATDRIFQAYDPGTQQLVSSLPLSFHPTSIVPLGPKSFVLCSRSQTASPLWVFVSVPQPAVYFVPAIQTSAAGEN